MAEPLVVVRFYAGDGQRHHYLADDVNNLGGRGAYAIPVCQDGQFSPWRHDPERISAHDLPEPGYIDGCPGCAVWARRNRHTALLRGEVFA
jgi:hypothetical protein